MGSEIARNKEESSDRCIEQGARYGIAGYSTIHESALQYGDSTSMKLFETIIDEEQIHFNYFDDVKDHINELGAAYLATIAGTPSATGLQTQGFVAAQGGA